MFTDFCHYKKLICLDSIHIDSFDFILHKLTVALFVISSALTSSSQLFGNPILCTSLGGVDSEVSLEKALVNF
jgi:hypothetical protein